MITLICMDPITHASLGAVIAQAGFRERLGKKGILFGICCSLFPDIDVLVRVAGEWAMMSYHRGMTHSLILLSILAPLAGYLGYICSRRRDRWITWFYLALCALLVHPLLDVCTSYGTQIFFPWTTKRFAIDAIGIIDIFYTIPLLISLGIDILWHIFPKFSRFLSIQKVQKLALCILMLTTGYLLFGYLQSTKAISIASVQLQTKDFPYREIRAIPTISNIGLWRIVARDWHGNLQVGMISTVDPREITFQKFDFPNNAMVKKVLAEEKGRLFQWFAMDMLSVSLTSAGKKTQVHLHDQRYGLISSQDATIFNVCADLDENGNVLEFKLLRRTAAGVSIKEELKAMWKMLWNS